MIPLDPHKSHDRGSVIIIPIRLTRKQKNREVKQTAQHVFLPSPPPKDSQVPLFSALELKVLTASEPWEVGGGDLADTRPCKPQCSGWALLCWGRVYFFLSLKRMLPRGAHRAEESNGLVSMWKQINSSIQIKHPCWPLAFQKPTTGCDDNGT